MSDNALIEMRAVTKTFGSLKANDGIDLSVKKGEVHAILGENGAGKSTLMNVLTGIYTPDHGTVSLNGVEKKFRSPQDAINSGIGMIYQHFKLADAMTAWQNICAGSRGSWLVKPAAVKKDIQALSDRTDLHVDLDRKIRDMGVGEKQTVEILKVLHRGAEILILDEPTTVLTPQETERLFKIIRKMKSAGKTTIIITHKLSEVMAISDRVTVLRRGQVVDTVETKNTDQKNLASMMVGQSMRMEFPSLRIPRGAPVMDVADLSVRDDQCMRSLSNISFTLHSGEILGIAGVSGSGQMQLCQAIMGLLPKDHGTVVVNGEDISQRSTREIVQRGLVQMGYVPEDRVGMGLVTGMDLVDNLILKEYRDGSGPFVDRKAGVEKTHSLVNALDIMHPGIHKPIRVLSGGNMQKVLIGREITGDPDVLIVAYPVRGLDLGVTHKVIDLLNKQKERGAGVLLIAEDLDLLLEVADRIMVMYCGAISDAQEASLTSKEELGLLMSSDAGACIDD